MRTKSIPDSVKRDYLIVAIKSTGDPEITLATIGEGDTNWMSSPSHLHRTSEKSEHVGNCVLIIRSKQDAYEEILQAINELKPKAIIVQLALDESCEGLLTRAWIADFEIDRVQGEYEQIARLLLTLEAGYYEFISLIIRNDCANNLDRHDFIRLSHLRI
jgi:hypothetical protein